MCPGRVSDSEARSLACGPPPAGGGHRDFIETRRDDRDSGSMIIMKKSESVAESVGDNLARVPIAWRRSP